ncbi:39S ribosomal protein L22 mitochondrial [Fasciola hepatica]|uniref:39S ribosomal protein L22 mitochondrial n=1 Tax=Fasciola hepatica TaxID=6192 RepID=A0A4E0REC4_FASHE|nr:39S ribosomal protein L22 mitochondrial [Fasciola hepatica]
MIRGMAVDDAFAQLGFRPEKGARILEQFTYPTLSCACLSPKETVHVGRGRAIPRVYKGVRTQIFMDNYHYADLFIRLREGDPPEVYHPRDVPATWTLSPACPEGGQRSWGSGTDILHRELNRLRSRRLKSGL